MAADLAAIRALAVHAKDEAARRYYEQFDFISSPSDPLHLLVLLKGLPEESGGLAGELQFPRIEKLNASGLKIGDVASYDYESVNESGRGDESVSLRYGIGHMQTRTAQRNCSVDRQNSIREGRQDLLMEPVTQKGALHWIAAFDQEQSDFVLEQSDAR